MEELFWFYNKAEACPLQEKDSPGVLCKSLKPMFLLSCGHANNDHLQKNGSNGRLFK